MRCASGGSAPDLPDSDLPEPQEPEPGQPKSGFPELDLPDRGPHVRDTTSPTRRWADLRLRVVSAAVLLPLGLVCLWLAPWSWALLLAAAAIGMALEWVALCAAPRRGAAAGALCLMVVLATLLAVAAQPAAARLTVLAFALVTWIAAGRHRHRRAIAGGCLYIGLPLISLIWLRDDPIVGVANLLFVLLVIWSSDIAAYAAGRWFGGPRLAPLISPGKTWSGATGGLIAAMLVGAAAAYGFSGGSATQMLFRAMPVAALLGIAGQLGDLFESGVKRWAGVKDSGASIPGHGGLLDRLDGVLAAAPAAALLAWSAGQGVYLWR